MTEIEDLKVKLAASEAENKALNQWLRSAKLDNERLQEAINVIGSFGEDPKSEINNILEDNKKLKASEALIKELVFLLEFVKSRVPNGYVQYEGHSFSYPLRLDKALSEARQHIEPKQNLTPDQGHDPQ